MVVRKTLAYADLIYEVNLMCKSSAVSWQDRRGVCEFLMRLLTYNNCYAGFRHYNADELAGPAKGMPADEYRRCYHIHKKLETK